MDAQELAALDLAVAKAEGWRPHRSEEHPEIRWIDAEYGVHENPHEDAEAMRLLVKHKLRVGHGGWWICDGPVGSTWAVLGETPAIAICRAVVALSGTPQPEDTQDQRAKV